MKAKKRNRTHNRRISGTKKIPRLDRKNKGLKRGSDLMPDFENAEYFKTLIENSADAIGCVNERRELVYLNLSASRILGYTKEELERIIDSGIIHHNDEERIYKEMGDVFAGVYPEIVTHCRVLHRDRTWRAVEIHARNFLSDPKVKAVVISARDITEQINAEDALQESEARYRSLVELSPEAIAIHEDGKFVYVNPAGAKLIGAQYPQELIGKSVLDIVHPDYHEIVKERVQLARQQGSEAPLMEEKLVRLDGSIIDVEVVAIPVSFKGRHAVQVVVRDLTERKQSEETLHHRDAILEAVGYAAEQFLKPGSWQESIQDVLNRLGTILEVGWLAIFEKSLSPVRRATVTLRHEWVNEGIPRTIGSSNFTDLETVEFGFDRWLGVMNEGGFVRRLVKDMAGKERALFEGQHVVSLAAVPIFVGSLTWGFMTFADCLTERKWSDAELYALKFAADILGAVIERQQYEYALNSTEQKYRMLFEESRDGVYISTPEGRFVDINMAGVQMLGYRSEEEVLALDIRRDLFFDQNQRSLFQRAIEEQGFVKDFELLIKRADGTKLTVLETASAVRDKEGKIVMYRGIFRDVTQQRQLEQDLIQIHKMESLGTLAAGIAHDFNNILSIILVYNSLIQRIANDPHKLAQSTGAIHEAVQRGANLVKQILTFARKTEVHVGPIDIGLAIKDVAKMLRETFPKTINLNLELANEIPFITADATQIQQVLLNLCVNARDAMPGGGILTVKSEMASGRAVHTMFSEAVASEYVHISVKDTGVGMDDATRSHVFDPFFTTKDKGKGTGLGLSVVYGAVKNHGGFVQVDSEPSRGSVFHLFFPIPSKILTPFDLKKGEEKEIPGGSETLLIVEDEEAIRSNIESLFVGKGYRVISARDGGEAVEIYKENRDDIHLVLSDLGLPTLSGDQVLFLLKAINPAVKVLFASGYFEPETKNELTRAGALDFIQKPYTPDEILRKVRKALDRA
jgi:PAS domain S-box-containing protein